MGSIQEYLGDAGSPPPWNVGIIFIWLTPYTHAPSPRRVTMLKLVALSQNMSKRMYVVKFVFRRTLAEIF